MEDQQSPNMVKIYCGNYAAQQELIMDASLKPVAKIAREKSWAIMGSREKAIFVAKLCLMFASFGWVYGNTLAPDEIPGEVKR
jgi:hypothetical protein